MPVIIYLFLGGCGGGLLFVSTVWSLLFYRSRFRTQVITWAFTALMRSCYIVGCLAVGLAAACLTIDLGQPARVFLLFTRPSGSVLSVGSYILLITVLLAIILVLVNSLGVLKMPSKAKKIIELLCAVSSFLLITYTGCFLQSMDAVPFWSSFALPFLFIFSSLSTGIALLFLAASFANDAEWLKKHLVKIHVGHRVILVFEVIALTVLLWQATLNATASRSLDLLFGPDLQLWFFVGAVGLGIAIPCLAELFAVFTKKSSLLPPLYVLCLLGGFCLRFCIVSVGIH